MCMCVAQRSWVSKFYVLYSTSDRNAARLDWYDDEKSFETNPSIRKTLFIEEIKVIERPPPDDPKVRQKYGDVGKSVHSAFIPTGTVACI